MVSIVIGWKPHICVYCGYLANVLGCSLFCESCGDVMVSVLECGFNTPGLSPTQGQGVVFLGKTLHSYNASRLPGLLMATSGTIQRVKQYS